MRALTLRQPWAWAITHAGKRIENRTWPTPYRGTILIHAGSKAFDDLAAVEANVGRLSDRLRSEAMAQRSSIVAIAELVDVIHVREFGDDLPPWAAGPYCWMLRNVRRIEPIKTSGRQGLWTPPDHVRRRISALVG